MYYLCENIKKKKKKRNRENHNKNNNNITKSPHNVVTHSWWNMIPLKIIVALATYHDYTNGIT